MHGADKHRSDPHALFPREAYSRRCTAGRDTPNDTMACRQESEKADGLTGEDANRKPVSQPANPADR